MFYSALLYIYAFLICKIRTREEILLCIKYQISVLAKSFFTEKTVTWIYGQRKNFFELKKVLLIQKKISLIQRNRFLYIKENVFESTKLFSIQRNFFFDCISKKCFFDSKKLFSGCLSFTSPSSIFMFGVKHSIHVIYQSQSSILDSKNSQRC